MAKIYASSEDDICYICHDPCKEKSPCTCGSWVHDDCLAEAITKTKNTSCTICKKSFIDSIVINIPHNMPHPQIIIRETPNTQQKIIKFFQFIRYSIMFWCLGTMIGWFMCYTSLSKGLNGYCKSDWGKLGPQNFIIGIVAIGFCGMCCAPRRN